MFLRDPKTKAVKWIAKEHHDKLMAEQKAKAELHKAEAERAKRSLRKPSGK